MNSEHNEVPIKPLPFDNLFLNSGYVNGLNNWYLYLSTLSFTILCYLLAPSLTSIHLLLIAMQKGLDLNAIQSNPNLLYDFEWMGVDRNLILIAVFGIFVFALLGFRFALRKFHHKTLISVLTAYEKFRLNRFLFGFGLWAIVIVITTLMEYLLFPGEYVLDINVGGLIISILLMIVFMPIQSGFEEILFRGYLMQGLALVFKNGWMPLICTSVLFGLAHMSNPEVSEYGWPMMLSYYVMFALFMGVITLLDEGLELVMGIHLANNFLASIFVCSHHSVIKTYSVFYEIAGHPVFEMLIWLLFSSIVFFILKKKYKWNNFKLILK